MHPRRYTQGIHHITAVTASGPDNLAFYRTVLGLRLVKKTVNFDDPFTYHFYYGDSAGTPGTILTFFPWEDIPRGRTGTGMVTTISFAVPTGALGIWSQRLSANAIPFTSKSRFGERLLRFSDPHGLALELIGSDRIAIRRRKRPGAFSDRHAIVGFHSATACVPSLPQMDDLLADDLGMRPMDRENRRQRYRMDRGDHPGMFFDVVEDKAVAGRMGTGTVHHIAFRARDDEEQQWWMHHLREKGYAVTAVRDRHYFRSIYFTAPGGILFEITTDSPGFTIDEPLDQLGRTLKLPSGLEPRRAEIEARLSPLPEDTFQHLFRRPGNTDSGQTLINLHGTGGSEHDLIEVARRMAPHAAIISPRGKVLEHGKPRYFRRISDGVFDEDDVVRRAHDLADFLLQAASRYDRSPEHLMALGYSNGANMAAAVLLLRPDVFSAVVLLRPMMPLTRLPDTDLTGKTVLVLTGLHDRVIPAESTRRLGRLLMQSGASVTTFEMDAGHEITSADLTVASRWLQEKMPHRQHVLPASQKISN